jgi:hypothetical protein
VSKPNLNAGGIIPEFLTNFLSSTEALLRATPIITSLAGFLGQTSQKNILELMPGASSDQADDFTSSWEKLSAQQKTDFRHFRRLGNDLNKVANSIPNFMLSAIVAETEVFLAEMTKWIFQQEPRKISSIKKSIEISDLEEARTISDLKLFFVDREIDDILRKNPSEQIENLEKISDLKILGALENSAEFFEIFERRNILVHAGGKVSRQYLSALKKN